MSCIVFNHEGIDYVPASENNRCDGCVFDNDLTGCFYATEVVDCAICEIIWIKKGTQND